MRSRAVAAERVADRASSDQLDRDVERQDQHHETSGSSTEIVIKGRFLSGRRAQGTITMASATVRGRGLPLIRCSDSSTWAARA